jgi:hypothetical protein
MSETLETHLEKIRKHMAKSPCTRLDLERILSRSSQHVSLMLRHMKVINKEIYISGWRPTDDGSKPPPEYSLKEFPEQEDVPLGGPVPEREVFISPEVKGKLYVEGKETSPEELDLDICFRRPRSIGPWAGLSGWLTQNPPHAQKEAHG